MGLRTLVALAACAGVLIPLSAGKSIPVAPSNPYLIDAWETDDGLPENSATSMVQTPDGYLWFGSFNGLVRFDGVRFSVFDPSNTPELPSPTVVTLHLDRKSRLWISTDKGLVRKDGARWRTFAGPEGWTSSLVRHFAESPSGALIAASFDGRIYRVAGERVEELPKPVPGSVDGYTIYFDSANRLCAANPLFYGHFNGEAWEAFPLPWTVETYEFSAPGANGTLLALRPDRLERYMDGRKVSEIPLPRPVKWIWQMREDAQGKVWVASYRSGLHIIAPDGEITHFGEADGLTYEGLRFTMQDRERNIWVGSSGGGLMRFKKRNFVSLGLENGLPNRVVKTVSTNAQGGVTAGTHGSGPAEISSAKAKAWDPSMQAPGYVWSTLTDSRGRGWIGSYAEGLRVREGSRLGLVIEGVAGRGIYALFEDAEHSLWAGSDDWIARVRDDQVRFFELGNGMRRSARCFAQDPLTGTLFAGTYGAGLWRFDAAAASWAPEPALPDEEIWSLHFDEEGALWIGTVQRGLIRFHDGRAVAVDQSHGLPARSISAIHEDGLGNFWLGSNQGIIRVAKNDLRAVADGKRARLSALLFNVSDGLPSVECAGGYQPTACRDAQGRLWFATLKGAVSVNPLDLALNSAGPRMVIEDVLVDGKSAPMLGRESIQLDPRSRRLSVRYAALSFTAPEKVVFQIQLEGLDKDWVDVASRRTAFYTDLKPGHYTFRAKAANNDGVWSESPATISFIMPSFFWQTPWFRLLVGLGIGASAAGAAWSLSRRRMQAKVETLEREKTLSQLRVRLASVLENTSDYVAFTDSQHCIRYLNPAGRKLLSLSPEASLSGLRARQFLTPEAYKRLQLEGFPAALRDGVWQGESALLRPDGEEIPVSQVLITHKKEDGSLDFTAMIARDLSAAKQAESALRTSEERLRRIAENLQDVLWMLDAKTRRLTYVSPAFERVWRRPVNDLRDGALTVFQTIHPDDRARVQALFAAVFEGQFDSVEYRIIRPDGEVRWIRDRAFPIRGHDGSLVQVAGIAEDFTDRKLQDERREALEAQLRQSQKMEAIGQLAGGVAHDFNNLLTIIQGNGEMLHAHRLPLEQQIHAAREICEAAKRAANLTRQLLTFSRRQAVRPQELDLRDVVRDTSSMLQRLIGEHIKLETHFSEARAHIHADAGMIEQIIVNLAVNARDAMPDGGSLKIGVRPVTITDPKALRNPAARAGDFVLLTVQDSGAGIQPEHLPRLFEPFFTTKEVGKGTGLGLATVFGIVQQHDGWIEVESRPREGAAFRVYFPAMSKGALPSRVSLNGWSDARGCETILLVEDEEQLRGLVKLLLEQQGYNVLEAPSGKAALEQFGDTPIDLLLTDMVMPDGVTGRALGEALQRRDPSLRVIYTSGYSVELVAPGFPLEDGVNFLPKPYHPSKLLNMVRNSLDSRPSVAASERVGI